MKFKLEDICSLRKEKISIEKLTIETYISTENMLPNKAGIVNASALPTIRSIQAYEKGDILISNIRPYFKKIWKAKINGGCSNDILVFKTKKNTDKDFLYYILADDAFFIYAMATSKGTKMPRGDKISIMQYEVPYFDVKIQKKIASILKSIDEKIEVYKQINNNLEQHAKAIFENEFLSLEILPKDWKQASLLDIADYLNGLAMQKYRPSTDDEGIPVLKIKELRQGYCDDKSELCSTNIKHDYIIHDSDVIFSWSGSLLVDFWCGGTCGLNQHLFKVTSNKYDKWFYYAWTKYYLDHFIAVATDKATTMGHIKRDELAKAKVIIPNSRDYKRIGALIQPIYDLIITNRIENRKLISLRDSILPKLMSGELDVSKIDI
ncbi:restriction endonuclease subunit S [Fusobacterium sp. oral taxon 203]|uniref:restriction endonuclease subunit S n=1 Tax=Fusobacterium sp. oral taxon 203 TaxID=671211 RepID=UPI000B925705|nr:restriction endonuclease subunit S [Fusobacterium sp. oral taxon 203]ASS38621.1 hypothetical protein AXF16_00170 [Fusobacterium sp. oral taxon 203]